MKPNIHPKWNHQALVTCACGATFHTGSGLESIQVDICSQCHPFFTGEMRFVDIQGRVEKFKNKQAAAAQKKGKKTKKAQTDKVEATESKSLKEILQNEKGRLAKTETPAATEPKAA